MLAVILSIIIALIVAAVCYSSMKPVAPASGAEKYFEKEINLSLKNDTFLRTEKKLKKED